MKMSNLYPRSFNLLFYVRVKIRAEVDLELVLKKGFKFGLDFRSELDKKLIKIFCGTVFQADNAFPLGRMLK